MGAVARERLPGRVALDVDGIFGDVPVYMSHDMIEGLLE
jgi:hypothetical protein